MMRFTCLLIYFTTHVSALQINLITYTNGVGLTQDIDLLTEELSKLGHDVKYVHFLDMEAKPKADINIFIEHLNEHLFQLAEKNYFIPNPEWYCEELRLIPKLDLILCKTREAEHIFKKLNSNVTFMSFTSQDRYDEGVVKDYKCPIHLVGKSIQKGTDAVYKVWKDHPAFPMMILAKHGGKKEDELPNLKVVYEYMSDSDILLLQNHCGIHLCPSETEGFGHYIFEALSCGAVVVTTNAPPMNEFIKDSRCLVAYNHVSKQRLAMHYHVDAMHLGKTLEKLLRLPEEELKSIGRRNREFYLENDRFFKRRLREIFGEQQAIKKDLASL